MATTTRVEHVYNTQIKPLSVAERLELLALVAHRLAEEVSAPGEPPKHSIMELEGLGKEIWEGIEAQEYVNKLRDEWDRPG